MDAVTQFGKPVRYFDGVTPVRLGDVIVSRVWYLWKKKGRVVYVPGISKKHCEFEHHGLCWIGVKAEDGMLFGSIVMPETGCLQKKLQFLGRDESPCEVVTPAMKFPE